MTRRRDFRGDPSATLTRLYQMTVASVTAKDIQTAIDEILAAAIDLHDADFGNIQLMDADRRELYIVAQRNFSQAFLDRFAVVDAEDDSACGRAMRTRETCRIEDVEIDPQYRPYLAAASMAGYRAVQSVPLICSNGDLLGVLSTHFREPWVFSDWHDLVGKLISRQAADLISNRTNIAELAARDRSKDAFLGTLGHELRNPLAAIQSGLELIRSPIKQVRDDASVVLQRQSDQLLSLVNDLLDVERIKRGKFALKREAVDVSALVKEVSAAYQRRIAQAGLDLNVEVPESAIYVNGDRTRLKQALENLVENALRFTECGCIYLSVKDKNNYAQFLVRDTGIGIEPKQQLAIFEPYYQTTEGIAAAGSLGFGLALVKGIVEKHDGTIRVRSNGRGCGAEFSFTVPLVEHQGAAANEQEPAPAVTRHRILVVDDEPDNANTFGALLRMLNHEVSIAYDGKTALEIAHTKRPEVAFIDLSMPRMDGHELAQQLRKRFSSPALFLIALSGLVPDDRAADFDHYLVKPVKQDDVTRLLATIPRHGAE